jgi:hypothetical protein
MFLDVVTLQESISERYCMIIYLGLPIDTSKPEHSPSQQISEVTDILDVVFGNDYIAFNPLMAFVNATNIRDYSEMSFLIKVNFEALRSSNLAIFRWNGSPSYGMCIEIETCVNENIPFIVWNTTDKKLGIYLRQRVFNSKGIILDTKEQLVKCLEAKAKGG